MAAGSVVTGSRPAPPRCARHQRKSDADDAEQFGKCRSHVPQANKSSIKRKERAFAIHDTRTGHRPRLAGVPCVNAAKLLNEAGGQWCRGPPLKLTCSVGGFPSNQRVAKPNKTNVVGSGT